MPDLPVSHGRGGAANISKDDTPYVDGAIVREGPLGDQGDGAYSTGRGGVANIGSPGMKATKAIPGDREVVPELAIKEVPDTDHHTGRGGGGNIHLKDKPKDAPKAPQGLAEKLKSKLFGKKQAA